MLRARVDEIERDAMRDRAVAWMTAMLHRRKRLPQFDSFVGSAKKRQKSEAEMEEIHTEMKELAESAGLTLYTDEVAKQLEQRKVEDGAE